MSTPEMNHNDQHEITPKRKYLTSEIKRAIYEILLQESRDGNDIRRTSGVVPEFFFESINNVSRKRVEFNLDKIKDILLRRRTNIRSLAKALKISKSTIHRRIREGNIPPNSTVVKLNLTEENKKARLEFSLSIINKVMVASNPSFINMHDYIHFDEKWFYMSNTTQKY
ncbi:hypothetical protein C2S53_008467 [Perilla frutescens var. hirtella]|uniref:Transposase Tc1-like domain-containing protein n=1 Tax=Perilla frutescens var. hirtella TaxID=608512 RepID=A0AAD4P0S7_PERFH|nr:hypothetical protein C2S53_008467 [Perilla frutescens var. hirtella]